ncbi:MULTISPECIES: class I SAM-dependent methyltransferase [unclassified Tolypothrix]|uniref:class I SAM-dependent methyltransferase n=1 Tax=unclassified Tolypothrix TaxID=2649714 RepID=UPI0005EAB491|nr:MULTISPECIES: hypothetical protein [unclassified Tolypothrix]BAY92023.1 putative glycosyltransferase [Microchaete diplosiphon NIES-3275]EKF04781.1 hypothetical protein FDUTEX481_00939 [Tolypothrix sp. PCC 7601]MBE9081772.1 hypothetical protein [Tolypothrix sp. LEGE 11397]UYD26011.1 hypothetical protein HGR01_32675 [Tolypothrix sp. PCC 7712]UYD31750.1 hypothetical protein HG267_21850 [Tolypothrix sp. PCC 7601]
MKVIKKAYNLVKSFSTEKQHHIAIKNADNAIKNFQHPYQLNVGCGNIKFQGWVNIDLAFVPNVTDIIWDASQKFSFLKDESCSLIYNEHFLEHLDIGQGLNFLSECYRLLNPSGVLRIAMPSLDYVVQKYNSENWRNQDWLSWKEYKFIQTRAEMINVAFRSWGHQWLYDQEELERRLYEVGFKELRNVQWGISEISELNNRETRTDSMLICEAKK